MNRPVCWRKNWSSAANSKSKNHGQKLAKVFFSDDGSTALEVALKLAYQFSWRVRSVSCPNVLMKKYPPRFLSLEGAYHGDTVGAVSLGHIDLFHKSFSGLLFKTDKVMSPYCYRCPFNRAKPERDDARNYRKCNWECVGKVEKKFAAQKRKGNPFAAFVFEPLMQGAAGMIPQPDGWLKQVAEIARSHGALLIADEVMTGFGRTGKMFACQHENIEPDFLCLAKGLTGGYLPMAATLTHAENLRRVSRRIRGIQNIFSRAQLHWKSTWRGGFAGKPGNFARVKNQSNSRKNLEKNCAKN